MSSKFGSAGDRIAFLSQQFLGIPYQASTLTVSAAEPEQVVVNLEAVDCFTLLDYVEALRQATTFDEFLENLIRTRYRAGDVSFETRNHFFTDWPLYNTGCIRDITAAVGGAAARQTRKILNLKQGGGLFIQGLSPAEREVAYIPPEALDRSASALMLTGDYAGIFSDMPGLDVSHVGIIIRDGADILFRHASVLRGEVVDEDFSGYIRRKPGVVILRPQ